MAEDVAPVQPHLPTALRWTDGSEVFPECFWLATAAYAVVDENESCVSSGRVLHPAISSFAAELFAVLVAVAKCPAEVCVYSDCLTVVEL